MTNDPIEDLFRNEVVNNTTLEKPREIVWNKIAKELPSKKQTPIKDFVESVWFAAAVFGLIAVPYFYFFIENLNHSGNSNIQMVNEIVKHQLEIPSINHDKNVDEFKDLQPASGQNKEIEIVKNTTPKHTVSDIIIDSDPEITNESIDKPSARMNVALMSASSATLKFDSTNQYQYDSLKIETSEQVDESKKIVEVNSANDSIIIQNTKPKPQLPQKNNSVQSSTQYNKDQDAIKLNRNKFSYVDKVHKVSFELVKKTLNEQKFRSGDVEFKLIKENNQILLITNSKNIKQEIINQIQLNKDKIFNHFSNRKDFSNVR